MFPNDLYESKEKFITMCREQFSYRYSHDRTKMTVDGVEHRVTNH